MWFKKKANINGYNPNTAVDETDLRTTYKTQEWLISQTLPSAADANKYFYLPTLGYYYRGEWSGMGYYGVYWSSTGTPTNRYNAYVLHFTPYRVTISVGSRNVGYRVGTFE